MMKNKKLLLGILAIMVAAIGGWLVFDRVKVFVKVGGEVISLN